MGIVFIRSEASANKYRSFICESEKPASFNNCVFLSCCIHALNFSGSCIIFICSSNFSKMVLLNTFSAPVFPNDFPSSEARKSFLVLTIVRCPPSFVGLITNCVRKSSSGCRVPCFVSLSKNLPNKLFCISSLRWVACFLRNNDCCNNRCVFVKSWKKLLSPVPGSSSK